MNISQSAYPRHAPGQDGSLPPKSPFCNSMDSFKQSECLNKVSDAEDIGALSEAVEGTPVIIHDIYPEDTLRLIAKRYGVRADTIMVANGIHNLTPDCLEGRKYLVIPSTATFTEPTWDGDEERMELCRNLMILLQEDFHRAYHYLERANYVLPEAIELYYYDLC